MVYKASFDKTTKIITAITTVLFLLITIIQVAISVQYHTWIFFASALLLPVIYVVTYLYYPAGYCIDKESIVIHRPGSDIRFSRSDICSIQLVQKERLKGTIRLFGVGGLFGYYGQFSNAGLGYMTWYATKRRDKMVLIELTNKKKIMVTPDEPEQFVEQLEKVA